MKDTIVQQLKNVREMHVLHLEGNESRLKRLSEELDRETAAATERRQLIRDIDEALMDAAEVPA